MLLAAILILLIKNKILSLHPPFRAVRDDVGSERAMAELPQSNGIRLIELVFYGLTANADKAIS
jgi:hypothetical protein